MKKKYLLIGICVLLLSGCIVRFVYNHLDWIVPWYVGNLINLNDDQGSELEKKLLAQLKWHRVTQLSEYSKSLKELSKAVKKGITLDDLERFHLTMRQYWKDLVRHVIPDMAKILSTASDEQVKELLENLKKRNQKYKEKYIDLPEEALREKKRNRMTRFLEYCMGDLIEEQEKIVEKWSHNLKNISEVRLKYIKFRQEKFKQILERRKETAWFEKEMCELFYFDRETWPKELREVAFHNRELTKRTFIEINKCMTNDQKKEFFENSLSLAEDFDELSREK